MIAITPDITNATLAIIQLQGEDEPTSDDYQLTGFDFWSSILYASIQFAFVCIYFLYKQASLSHPQDTDFGNSWFAKIIVYLGMVLSMAGIIYVQADLVLTKNTQNSKDFNEKMWQGIILLQLIYVWIICPLTFVYYGSNEDVNLSKRLVGAVKVQLPMFVALFLLAIPTYLWLNETKIPKKWAEAYGITEGFVYDTDGEEVIV